MRANLTLSYPIEPVWRIWIVVGCVAYSRSPTDSTRPREPWT